MLSEKVKDLNENSINEYERSITLNEINEQTENENEFEYHKNLQNEDSVKKLMIENQNLNEALNEQEEALYKEIQKNAKLEKCQIELQEQLKYSRMEINDLYQKITYITNRISCDDLVKNLIYRQQAEIISLKEELTMSKNTSTQLKSRLKCQVEDLKYIKRQSMQITSEMAKEVEIQLSDIQAQLHEANQKIYYQQKIIDNSKYQQKDYEKTKDELKELKKSISKENEEKEKNYEKIKECFIVALEKINDLKKEKEDAYLFFNEAGEEIINANEKYEMEKKNSYQMANEMGQQIIDLTDKIENYEKIIKDFKTEKILEKEDVTSQKIVEKYQKQFSETKNSLSIISEDLMEYKKHFTKDTNSNRFIEKINEKIQKVIELINETEIIKDENERDENEKITGQLEKLDEEIKGLLENNNNKEIGELENETDINVLSSKYKDEMDTINEIGNELVNVKQKNNSYKKEVESLCDLVVKLMGMIVDLQKENDEIDKLNQEYLNVINETGEDVNRLHFVEKDLIKALTESGNEICVLKYKINEIIEYHEKYMSVEDEVLVNKVAVLTSRNNELENELALLRRFDVNSNLKKSLEEGQLQSAWYEITKLRSVVDKLTQNSKKLERELSNARSEIKSIIQTRDDAILTKDEAMHNLKIIQDSYLNQVKKLKEEIIMANMNNNNNNNNLNNSYQNLLPLSTHFESRLLEAEEIIDRLTRENNEYSKKMNKLNKINEKLILKLLHSNGNDNSTTTNNINNNNNNNSHNHNHNTTSNNSNSSEIRKNKRRSLSLDDASTTRYDMNNNSIKISMLPKNDTDIRQLHLQQQYIQQQQQQLNGLLQSQMKIPMTNEPFTKIEEEPIIKINTTSTQRITPQTNNNNLIPASNISTTPTQNITSATSTATTTAIDENEKEKIKDKTQLTNQIKSKNSMENINKKNKITKNNKKIRHTHSQLNIQSSMNQNDNQQQQQQQQQQLLNNEQNNSNRKSKELSKNPIIKNILPKSLMIKENEEEYRELMERFGKPPVYSRIVSLQEEQSEMENYLEFEIQNQCQIMEAIRNGEIPFYSSDDQETEEIIIIE